MPLLKKEEKCNCGCSGYSCVCNFSKKILFTLVGILLVYGIFYVGTLMRNNIKQYDFIGKADKMERMITVNGYGKVTGTNDIAVTTIGYSNTDKDVAKAQNDNKVVMDKIMGDLKAMSIEQKDLKSDYSIYPEYDYTDKGQQFKGYRVNNNITVKIRDLSKIENVLGLAGKYGANQVNGLTFTIDDPENLKTAAREKALADAKVKAEKLSKELGVRLVAIVSYNEYQDSGYAPVYDYAASSMKSAVGMGGGVAEMSSGSQDVSMNVNITYEIAQ